MQETFYEAGGRALALIQVAKKRMSGADLAAANALEGFILVLLAARQAVGDDDLDVRPADLVQRAAGRYTRKNLRLIQNADFAPDTGDAK